MFDALRGRSGRCVDAAFGSTVALRRQRFVFACPQREQREFDGDEAPALRRAARDGWSRSADERARSTSRRWRAAAAMLYEGPLGAERHAAIRAFFDAHPEALTRGPQHHRGRAPLSATDAFVADAHSRSRALAREPVGDIDVLVVPTAPTSLHHRRSAGRAVELNRRLGTYTNFVNLLDLAALAVRRAMHRATGFRSASP